MKQYCPGAVNGITEAWCLQYNQHLGKTLLLPVEEPKRILDQVIKETIARKLPEVTSREKYNIFEVLILCEIYLFFFFFKS